MFAFTATDDAGNSTSAQQTITVQDTTAPELSIPADYTSECDVDLILDDATASDNCGEVTIEVSSETIAGDAAGNYTVVRTFTATDDAGNSTCSADHHRSGHDSPEIHLCAGQHREVECSDEWPLEAVLVEDGCGLVTVTETVDTSRILRNIGGFGSFIHCSRRRRKYVDCEPNIDPSGYAGACF